MKKLIAFLFLFLFAGNVQAEILINEFSIEPDQAAELINSGVETIDISNWRIDDSGGTTFFTIPENSLIYPNSCVVLSANFNLNTSSSDTIRLFNADTVLIDSFTYNSSPGAGISFLRLPDATGDWVTQNSSFGKFNQSGENCIILHTSTPTIAPSPAPTIAEEPTPTTAVSYTNIFISEVMVAPESGQKEWVELYNLNDFSVTLSNWYIDDEENAGASPKAFSLTISAKGYSSFELATSMFNNSGDSIRLLDNQKLPKDSLEYTESEQGKSLGRISFEDDTLCIQEPTKNSANGSCISEQTEAEVESSSSSSDSLKTDPTAVPSQVKRTTIGSNTTSGGVDATGSVLGVQDDSVTLPLEPNNLGRPLSFLSFAYSVLTMVSILLKMKINV